ncbi:Uncharacterised protein [Shigella sonnei]|nr:Uncharacterised protein [Shigella sonnei]CSF91337.1 Uncharacterised protein [Shigella sonnei]CSP58833.1 Uncharacterised protein [Shigella sonnei]CSQ71794.1 Uncharacterised protein [Shigella sonnei]
MALQPAVVKVFASGAFRCRLREIWVAEHILQQWENNFTRPCPLGIFIVRFTGLTPDPGIHQHVTRTGIVAANRLPRNEQ